MQNNNNGQHYLEQLTWLRGIAAFFVIISHTLRATENTYLGNEEIAHYWLLYMFDLGTFGVLLFFALSGTTLYISNIKPNKPFNIKTFYIKRFFRIWPAFFVALVLYISFAFIFKAFYGEPQGNWIEKQFLMPYQINDLISYLTLSFNIWGQGGLFNNAFWSLPVEFQYYLIFPLIVFSLTKWKMWGPISIAALLYGIFKFNLIQFNDMRFFMLGFTFCGGVLLGYLFENHRIRIPNKTVSTLLFFSGLILTSLINNNIIELPNLPVISNIWIVLGVAALAIIAITLFGNVYLPNKLKKLFFNYGEVSYSAYLLHNLFIAIAVLLLIHFSITDALYRIIIVLTIGGGVSYLCSLLTYNYIEKPYIKKGRNISNLLNKK